MRFKGYLLLGLLMLVMLTGCGDIEWFPGKTQALTIVTTTLPDAVTGVPYSQTLLATGGKSPYGWTVVTGSLPDGLTLTPYGVIAGTPSATAQTSKFKVQVVDSASPVVSATQELTITVMTSSALMGGAIQKALTLAGTVTTFAGSAGNVGSTDSSGTGALFNNPNGITTDGTYLYVADNNNHTIRKIELATGAVTTVAGIAETSGAEDGTGTKAAFNYPYGITTDGTNLYVADTFNCTIRKIVMSTGVVTTIAGTAGVSGSADGTGAEATFNYPFDITTDGTSLYVADSYNSTIRKIMIATGKVTTLAGTAGISGSANGTGEAASFNTPFGITTDGTNLYVADSGNSIIRKIVIATGEVTTIAGTSGSTGSTDGTGATALFNQPWGITTDGTNLYVFDTLNNIIRKIVIGDPWNVTTIAGTAGEAESTDGNGATARFNGPSYGTTDGVSLYVTDAINNTIRKIQ